MTGRSSTAEALREAYGGKKVLVTGHTGFKGSWLSLWLNRMGAEVIGYSLEPPSIPNLFDSIGLDDLVTHIKGDVRDEGRLASVFSEHCPEFVFHMAAQSLVRPSYQEPKLTFETNVMGTINVLECVRKSGSTKVCVNVTSDKCYENMECDRGYRETDPMGGYDPYSCSKGCAELVTSAYRRSFFSQRDGDSSNKVALSSVRAGNVIGGGDWGIDRIVPDCIRAISKGEPISIRSPGAVRPWQYILDPLCGYLLLGALMRKGGAKYCGAWNFGPNDSNIIPVEELVKLLIKHWGRGEYTVDGSRKPHEAKLLKLNIEKACSALGWKPVYGINDTVKRTVDWYKRYYGSQKGDGLREATEKEIDNYMETLDNDGK